MKDVDLSRLVEKIGGISERREIVRQFDAVACARFVVSLRRVIESTGLSNEAINRILANVGVLALYMVKDLGHRLANDKRVQNLGNPRRNDVTTECVVEIALWESWVKGMDLGDEMKLAE